MENSTKALLLGGAALIIILLISVGMNLFNSAANLSDQVDASTQSTAAANFNAQFLPYLGDSIPGTKVKELVKKVMINNIQANSSTFSPEKHQIHLTADNCLVGWRGHLWDQTDMQICYNDISDTATYKIGVNSQCDVAGASGGFYNGYILCIVIYDLYDYEPLN